MVPKFSALMFYLFSVDVNKVQSYIKSASVMGNIKRESQVP